MKTTTLWTALLVSGSLSLLPACKDKSKDMPAGDMGGEMAKPADEMAKPADEMAKPADEMAKPAGEMEAGAPSDDKKMEPGK